MSNPDDADDTKINNLLYQLSLATRELIKDPNFNREIIDLALASENNSANLLDLETSAPQYYSAINANLATFRLTLKSIEADLTHMPIAPNPTYPQTAIVEQYVPSIYVPNLNNIDDNLQPLISPNIVVDGRFDPSVEDNIITWYYQSSSSPNVTEIILSEATSITTRNPLFLIDNGVTTIVTVMDSQFSPMLTANGPTTPNSQGAILSFSTKEISIESSDYKYETFWGGRSEFCVMGIRIEPNGTVHWLYNNNTDLSKRITRFNDNEIGTIKNIWSHHADNWVLWASPWTPSVPQNGVNLVFWNTFERDWNRSAKGLGTVDGNSATFSLSGNRKYTSEWYAWIPSTTNLHFTRFLWVYNDWAHWNNSWKSKFRIWRVQS